MPRGEDFYNPYRLVRQPGDSPRRDYRPDLSKLTGYVGTLECLLEAHTPLEINYKKDARFSARPRIPGSSLKGTLRSMAELVGGGCVSSRTKMDKEGNWAICSGSVVCPTCDLFGRIYGEEGRQQRVNKGKVLIGEAVPAASGYGRHPIIYLRQGSPKETHTAFYPPSEGRDCHRKLYHHHPSKVNGINGHSATMKHVGRLHPVEAGSCFEFSLTFTGLDAKQLALLGYCLELEPGLLHKMGRGKGHGLGSVKIKIRKKSIQDASQRYRGGEMAHEWPRDVKEELQVLQSTPALDEVRKMLSWEAAKALPSIHYPSYHWFKAENGNKRNSQTLLRTVSEVFPQALPPLDQSSDPPLPKLRSPVSAIREVDEPTQSSCPDGFPEKQWDKLDNSEQSLVKEICAIGSYKGESAPYIEKYRKAQKEGDEKKAELMLQAFKVVVPKKEKGWMVEHFGKDPWKVSDKEKAGAPKASKKDPFKEAVECLETLETAKKIRKKIPKKYFKDSSGLSEDQKKQLAQLVKDRCEFLEGGAKELKKMKSLQPYLE